MAQVRVYELHYVSLGDSLSDSRLELREPVLDYKMVGVHQLFNFLHKLYLTRQIARTVIARLDLRVGGKVRAVLEKT